MVLAKTLGAMLFSLFNALVPLAFAAFAIDFTGVAWGVVWLGVLLIGSGAVVLTVGASRGH